jgi:hypothetical protein
MIFTDTIQHYKFLRKNLIFWFELFFPQRIFGCNVPPFGILDECSSRFDFTQSETVDMPTPKSAVTLRKISPLSIRLTTSNFRSVVITTHFSTSRHFQYFSQPPISVQLSSQHVSSSPHCCNHRHTNVTTAL